MLEIACFNASSAINAASVGANRIELCADYATGGVTPPLQDLIKIREVYLKVPVNVMIRPRAGNFVYTDAEFSDMVSSIDEFKDFASGFVFGILDRNNRVDIERNSQLVKAAGKLPCTFHRASDAAEDKYQAAKDLITCGFSSVLTSGGGKNAMEGADVIAHLQENFGSKISFIAGGGVRSTNIAELKKRTCVEWYHSAAITGTEEQVNEEEVSRMIQVLNAT